MKYFIVFLLRLSAVRLPAGVRAPRASPRPRRMGPAFGFQNWQMPQFLASPNSGRTNSTTNRVCPVNPGTKADRTRPDDVVA
jgi:hypothetical protein